MKTRIVLSTLLVCTLSLFALACESFHANDDVAPDVGGETSDGIGTSPSLDTYTAPVLPTHGVWVDTSEAAADARALAGAPADLIAFPGNHVTASDLILMSQQRWPGKTSVRMVRPIYIALQATFPPAPAPTGIGTSPSSSSP